MFSYIGYVTEEVPINNRSAIDVTLAPDVKTLGEVVVVGYGPEAGRPHAWWPRLKARTSKTLPAKRLGPAVVNAWRGSSQRFGVARLRLQHHHPGCLPCGTKPPLYIVDGVRQSGDNINLQDMESVDVLKDQRRLHLRRCRRRGASSSSPPKRIEKQQAPGQSQRPVRYCTTPVVRAAQP